MFSRRPVLLLASCVVAVISYPSSAGNPNSIPLSGPVKVNAGFAGDALLTSGQATALSMATGDFDMDGYGDLAVGYATADGGRVAIYRGNVDAFAPQSDASFWAIARTDFPSPFLPNVQVVAIPGRPDFLATGMFIGHDGPSLVAATRGGSTIYVLAPDASGQFQLQQTIDLPGLITVLGASRLYAGAYAQVVIGVRSAAGSALLVYTGSNDGLAASQNFSLTADATALAFSDFDRRALPDMVVVAGGSLWTLLGGSNSLESIAITFQATAAAFGTFVFDQNPHLQIAVLANDGSVHILAHESFDPRPHSLAEMQARRRQNLERMRSLTPLGSVAQLEAKPTRESWKEIESFTAVALSANPLLFRTRISDHRADDVLLLDGARLLVIAHPDSKQDNSDAAFAAGVILSQAEPYTGAAAALTERVNVDGRPGVIVLTQDELTPAVMMPLPDPTFFPNRFDDIAPRGTGVTCLNTGGVDGSGDCTLREAIIKANATAGTDTIMLQAGTYTLTQPRTAVDHSSSLTGTLEVQDSVNIVGAGQNTTIVQGGTSLSSSVDKVFSFNQDIDSFTNATVSLSNLTVKFGFNRGNVAIFDGWGGAFDFDTGTAGTATLSVTNCTIANNGLNDGEGGGVALFNSNGGSGTATFSNTVIQNNNAHRNPSDGIMDPNGAGNGGGLAVLFPATATLTNTQVNNNTATQVQGTGLGQGGGIFKVGGGNLNLLLSIHGGSVSINQSAGQGGGILITSALSIDQGTAINGNTAGASGGGVWVDSGNAGESATLSMVTITGNNASGTAGSGTGVGGGVFVGPAGGPATISFSRFAGNSAAVTGSNNLATPASAPGSAVTATNNWWGTNAPSATISPNTSHCAPAAQQVCFDPFIVLTHMGSPQKIRINQSSTLTGDMSKDNHGASVGLANLGRIIGLPITFDSPVLGSIPEAQPETLNASAQATATFNAGGTAGIGSANATVDQAVVPVNSNLIASATEVSTTATITTVGAHGLTAGTQVVISGVSVSGYNGTFFIASAPTVNTFTYTANSSGLAASSGGTANAGILVVAPPAISKAFGAASIPLGGSTSLSFTIQNPNSSTTLNGIGFSDTLPSGLIISTPNGLSGSCGGGALTATQNTSVISLSGASLAASGTCTFMVNVTGTAAGSQTNTTGNVTSTEGGTGGTASASIAVVAPPTIGKAFGAASIPLNGTTSLTFTLTNPAANTVAETGVAFSDTLPSGLVVANPNGLSNTCGGVATAAPASGLISLTGGTIAINSSCTVAVTVMGTTGGVKNNTSGAVSSTNGGTGNTASASITVAAADLQLTKAITAGVSGGIANTGTNVTYTISVTNNGPSDATAVTVTDTLPANLTLVSCTPSVGSCVGTTATLGTLANLASATVTIVASVNCNVADGSVIGANSATVSSSTPDPTPGNNTGNSGTFTARNPTPIIVPTVALSSLGTNHDLFNIGLAVTASDGSCPAPTTFTVQVFGNEDDETATDSQGTVFSPDAKDIGIGTLRLRGERVDSGNGRVYLIVVSAMDSGGAVGFGTLTVVVPKSGSQASQDAVAAAAASAKAFADANNGAPPAGYFVIGDGPIIGSKQ